MINILIIFRRTGPYIQWRNKEKLHRLDGPAAILPDGDQYWYKDGLRHRDDGPAVILSDGTEYWCKENEIIDVSSQ